MTQQQWNELLAVIRGEQLPKLPVGFIIDCPWLPAWAGLDIADYLTSETHWFEANRKAIETFPDATFLPGFWSEFGMCTEPSAFGSRCTFPANEFPYAEKIITDPAQVADLKLPNPPTTASCRSCCAASSGHARASRIWAIRSASPSRAARSTSPAS